MAYKYLNDDGLKAYTKKVKGTFKDLHSPIAISSENTTESMAQNVKNIADYVEKAKAAGIADVDGMAVTCIIDAYFSGVGCILGSTDVSIQGIKIPDDLVDIIVFGIFDGRYIEKAVIVSDNNTAEVTSNMLVQGARRPIIFTPDTTEVDEETYQKLLSDNVDVVFKTSTEEVNLCTLTYKNDDENYLSLYFTCFSVENGFDDSYLYAYRVNITKTSPHTCSITENQNGGFESFLDQSYLKKSSLFPVLQEIDLDVSSDENRKSRLELFEENWRELQGTNNLDGARFIGNVPNLDNSGNSSVLFIRQSVNENYAGCAMNSDSDGRVLKYEIGLNGTLAITPLFSHLEAITIQPGNGDANVAAIKAYIDNLRGLGFDSEKGCIIPVIYIEEQQEYYGSLFYKKDTSILGSILGGIVSKKLGAGYYNLSVDKNDGSTSFDVEDPVIFDSGLSPIKASIEFLATCVNFTDTPSSNKTQLELYLDTVPNATVMHCTYKDVYAGTLYKINGSWYGVLVGESNTLAGQLSIKLQADGTIVEGTA